MAKRDAGMFEAFVAAISARPVSGTENCAHVTPDSVSTPLRRGCGVDIAAKGTARWVKKKGGNETKPRGAREL